MLAAFFLAGDMATRPIRLSGQIVFGVGAGVLTIVARLYGGWAMAPLGAYSALLVMSTLTPLIDRLTRPKPPGGAISPFLIGHDAISQPDSIGKNPKVPNAP